MYCKYVCVPYPQRNKAGFKKKEMRQLCSSYSYSSKAKKDESHIVNISDITAEVELNQLLQTVLIEY